MFEDRVLFRINIDKEKMNVQVKVLPESGIDRPEIWIKSIQLGEMKEREISWVFPSLSNAN